MTLEQYAYLAEIIGVILIVATFIFLAVQLRQNTRAVKSATLQSIHNKTMTAYEMLMDDSMMDTFIKGMREPSDLTAIEKGKFNAFWTVALHTFQNDYFQIQAGTYDGRIQDGWWQVLRNNFLSPGFRLHWEKRKFVLAPEFREFVETEIMKRQPSPDYQEAVKHPEIQE